MLYHYRPNAWSKMPPPPRPPSTTFFSDRSLSFWFRRRVFHTPCCTAVAAKPVPSILFLRSFSDFDHDVHDLVQFSKAVLPAMVSLRAHSDDKDATGRVGTTGGGSWGQQLSRHGHGLGGNTSP